MKIMYVGHYSGLNGAERCFYESIYALGQRGVNVLAVLPDRGPLCDKLDDVGSEYVFRSFPRWVDYEPASFATKAKLFPKFIKATISFLSLVNKHKPDVIVTNTLVISPCAALAAALLRRPHVWYIHEFGREDHGMHYFLEESRIHRIISRLSRVVIVNSRIVRAKYLKDIPQEKVILINYAIDVKENPQDKLPVPHLGFDGRNPLRIILLGKMSPSKGQEEAVKAIKVLKDEGYYVNLSLIGGYELDYRDRIVNFIERHGLRDVVSLHEFTDDPHRYLCSHHLALICSRSEAFGRVTVEPMKLGKAVVGSRAGATPELIIPYFNGLLYSPGKPQDLAGKIAYFYNNPEQIGIMGENALTWSWQKFNFRSHGEEFHRILERVV